MKGDDVVIRVLVYFTDMEVNYCIVIQNPPKVGHVTVDR